ncbi:LicD family protein [Gemella bergeri]
MKIDKNNSNLNTLQKEILDIFSQLLLIFDNMNITYYIQGGTMLGAVRHQGFIPWDDDIDIAIPREQYKYFLNNVERYLGKNLELRVYDDNSDHHYYFSRIVNKNHQVKRLGSKDNRIENVWVDIFPLDGMPSGRIKREIHKGRLLVNRLLYHISCLEKVNTKRPDRSFLEKVIIKAASVIPVGKYFNTNNQLIKLDKLLTKYPYEKSDWVINFMGQTSYKFNELFPKKIYSSCEEYNFENLKVIGPKEYDIYLRTLYGDYMKLPKEKDRNAHKTIIVEVDRDDERNS